MQLHAKITASGGSPDAAMLSDGDLEKTTRIPIPAEGRCPGFNIEFPQPQTIRAVTFVTKDPGGSSAAWSAGMAPTRKELRGQR